MKRFTYHIFALLIVTLSTPVFCAKSFVGFTGNDDLGSQIANGLIQDLNNVTLTETSTGKYSLVIINVGEESTFTMGGVTFAYTPIQDGQTTYKTYNNYIQPNGNDREIRIPTVAGEQVKVVLMEDCSDILIDGNSATMSTGDNVLTAAGTSIVLRTRNNQKPKISSIVSLASDNPNPDPDPNPDPNPEPDPNPNPDPDPLTVADALYFGSVVPDGSTTNGYFAVTGYVSALEGDTTDFAEHGYQSYWITDDESSTASSNADGAFYVYRGVATEEIKAGDKVRVTTRLVNISNLILSEPLSPVVVIGHVDPNPDPDPDPVIEGRIEVRSNNCEYGTAVGGGLFAGGSQVTIVAVPATEDCVFDQWKDGVTDNPRIVTISEEHKKYVAIFHSNNKGKSFDPLDDDDNPSNPGDPSDPSDPSDPKNPHDPSPYRPNPGSHFDCMKWNGHKYILTQCTEHDLDNNTEHPPYPFYYGYHVVEI